MATVAFLATLVGLASAGVKLGGDSLGFYSQIKTLIHPPDRDLLLVNLAKDPMPQDAENIKSLYETLDKSKPITEKILQRLYRRYLALALFTIGGWGFVSLGLAWLMLFLPHLLSRVILDERTWRLVIVGVTLISVVVLPFAVSRRILKKPVTVPVAKSGLPQFDKLKSASALENLSLDAFTQLLSQNDLLLVGETGRALSGIGSISYSEKKFLEDYVEARTMVACLEAYLLGRQLEDQTQLIRATFRAGVTEHASRIVVELVRDGFALASDSRSVDPSKLQDNGDAILQRKFAEAGIAHFIDPHLISTVLTPDLLNSIKETANGRSGAGPDAEKLLAARVREHLEEQDRHVKGSEVQLKGKESKHRRPWWPPWR